LRTFYTRQFEIDAKYRRTHVIVTKQQEIWARYRERHREKEEFLETVLERQVYGWPHVAAARLLEGREKF